VHTEIVPLTAFYLAEEHHQKYYLRRLRHVYDELRCRFASLEEFLAEPLVTRCNAYAAGHGTSEQLRQDLESNDLSTTARSAFQQATTKRWSLFGRR